MRTKLKYAVCRALIFSTVSIVITMSHALAGKEVGYVERLSGEASGYAILRNGELLAVGLFTQVFADDQVILKADNLELVIRFGTSENEVITNAESPYTVSDKSNPATVTSNVASWLKKLLTPWHEKEVTSAMTMISRSGEKQADFPQLLLIPENTLIELQAGQRTLRLEWFGGTPPFSVDLYNQSASGLVESGTSERDLEISCTDTSSVPAVRASYRIHSMVVENIDLTPGDYRLFLADALGNVATRTLKAVEATAISYQESSVSGSQVPDYLAPIVKLVVLMEDGRAEHYFDGRQNLGDLHNADYPAQLLGRKLLCDSLRTYLP